MPSLTVTFAFPTDAQSFTATPGANSTLSYDGAVGNPAGALKSRITGKNLSNANKWARTLTYEAMGVPAGSTILSIKTGSMQSKCTEFTTGASSTSGAATLVDGVTTVTLSSARTGIAATDAGWVTTNGVDATGLSKASSNSVTITINNTLATGSSSSAAVTVYQDQLTFTITYSVVMVGGTSSYSLTANAAALLWNRLLAGATSAYTLSWNSAALFRFLSLAGATGAFSISGASSSLLWSHLLVASSASYAVAGNAALLRRLLLTANTGGYTLTGNAASLLRALKLAGVTGSFSVNGSATLLRNRLLVGAMASVTVSGAAAQLLARRLLAGDTSVYQLAGDDASLLYIPASHGHVLVGEAGVFVVTFADAALAKIVPIFSQLPGEEHLFPGGVRLGGRNEPPDDKRLGARKAFLEEGHIGKGVGAPASTKLQAQVAKPPKRGLGDRNP